MYPHLNNLLGIRVWVFCEHALNASVHIMEACWIKATIQSHFDPLKSHSNGTRQFHRFTEREREKNAHHSLGMRFYCSFAFALALSVELSAFAWSANESIILHPMVCVCGWVLVYVIWCDHQGELDTTMFAGPNASYCQLFISKQSTLYLHYIFWFGHDSWIRNINFPPIGWLGEFFFLHGSISI